MTNDLQDIVARALDIPRNKVTDDLERGKLETWDSLTHLLLISEIESELGIEFTTDEVLQIASFKRLKEIVSTKSKQT